MSLAARPAALLAWLGRHGTQAVAVSIFVGLALPQLAATFKPYLPLSVFFLLTFAFLRVEPSALRDLATRPTLVLAALAWTMAVAPALLGGLYLLAGIDRGMPELMLALVLQAAAPPITAGPAFAALMGLEAALSLAILVIATAVTPLTAPLIAEILAGEALTMSPASLGVKLFALLTGAAGLAWLIRAVAGQNRLDRHQEGIDGLNVVTLFIFAVALMESVAARLLSDPLLVLGLLLLTFAWSLAVVALTTFVFAPVGRPRAFVIGLAAGHRNLGLMIAAVGAEVPDLIWLYFALAQFPIYLLPQILKPLARRLVGPAA